MWQTRLSLGGDTPPGGGMTWEEKQVTIICYWDKLNDDGVRETNNNINLPIQFQSKSIDTVQQLQEMINNRKLLFTISDYYYNGVLYAANPPTILSSVLRVKVLSYDEMSALPNELNITLLANFSDS